MQKEVNATLETIVAAGILLSMIGIYATIDNYQSAQIRSEPHADGTSAVGTYSR